MALQTANVGQDTWRFIEAQIEQSSDWSLGQRIRELESAMEEHPEMSTDIYLVISRIEEELDNRALAQTDPEKYQERQEMAAELAAL